MSTLPSLDAEIRAALPAIKSGTLRTYGDFFGRPYDNIHTIVAAWWNISTGPLTIGFDRGEALEIWAPEGLRVSPTEFRVARASKVRWTWFAYGRPRTRDNLYFQEHVNLGSSIAASSDVDWYQPTFSPDTSLPAAELL